MAGLSVIKIHSILRCFYRAREGVTAIEFAIVAPVLLLMLFGIIEFSLIMLASSMLESSTTISSRTGKTGFNQPGVTREDTIIQSVKTHAGDFINTDHLTLTSKSYSQFNQIGQPEPWNDANHNGVADAGEYTDINGNGQWDADMGQAGYGGAEDIVVYTVQYPWPIITPIMREIMGDTNGNFIITARAVVRNEPYDDD